ncbi:YME2 [Candida pseudojiufengensis]|uniref:YME2 n=1 Tax=Candida pseudojiufengensis TaxID=497109 RepID=UPI002223FF98|nr:YME2 [Candida pseudojiufengensis]KAI5966797.1 YME2 [Candida pseudojiufengensis]
MSNLLRQLRQPLFPCKPIRPIIDRSLLHPRFYSTDIESLKKQSDSTETDNSVNATGVIDKNRNEVLLYYSFSSSRNIVKQYLMRLFSAFPFSQKYNEDNLKDKVIKISSPLPSDSKITELVPLLRDSGAFVKFQFPPDETARSFITEVRSNVNKNDAKRLDNFVLKTLNYVWNRSPKVYSVKGIPWIEDLRRFPSAKIGIKYEGNPLTEEELYVLFRRYGLIDDIKIEPTESYVLFHDIRSAICAKHCITGMVLNDGETTIHIKYVPIKKNNYIIDFISNHTKIAIPIILALLATFAVLIFDPIREFFIQYKITHSANSLEHYKQNKWFRLIYIPYKNLVSAISNSYDYIDTQIHEVAGLKSDEDESCNTEAQSIHDLKVENNMFWKERYEKSKQLKLWILENLNSYIIVKGPQGSGKEEFVLDHSLLNDERLSRKILVLECDELSKARSENSLISSTASQLGYFPVFTWTNSISQFVDLGVQGLTGQKSGLSESKETQLKNMFSLATQAIRHICEEDYTKYVRSTEKRNKKLSDEEKIEILRQEDFLSQHPESKPIIVVSKYSRRADIQSNDFIYPLIADWTSGLIQNNIAHVIILTADVGSIQHLNDALPNQVFKYISLSDASMTSSKQYVCDVLKVKDTTTLDTCLEPLGGRMLDLQAFIRRIKSGESPEQAITEMINQAAELITTFFLNNNTSKIENGDNNWNPAQVWLIMKILSNSDEINYAELTKSPLFKSSKETMNTLTTLEKYDLITLKRDKGVLNKISTGRPLFQAAFENIISDLRIWKLYETNYLTELITLEVQKIQKFENELTSIYKIGSKIDGRIDYLTKKIEGSNNKIVSYEKEIVDIASYKAQQKPHSFLGIKF